MKKLGSLAAIERTSDAQDDLSLRWVHCHFVGFVTMLFSLFDYGISLVSLIDFALPIPFSNWHNSQNYAIFSYQ